MFLTQLRQCRVQWFCLNMLFVVIITVFVGFSYVPPPTISSVTAWQLSLKAALLFSGLIWGFSEVIARLTTRRLAAKFVLHERIMRSYQRLRWMLSTALLGGYAGLVHVLDWPAVVRHVWGLQRWILVDDVLVLSPCLTALVLSWIAHFRVEDYMRRHLSSAHSSVPDWWSRRNHLVFLWRHHLGILLVPLAVLVTLSDVIALCVQDGTLKQRLELLLGTVGMGSIIVFAPIVLRLLWRAEPLPQGRVRERLERLARRLNFHFTDVLIWRTHGSVINAAVAGILPWPRYVLLSDGLLEYLEVEEVEAVFGHEVGHVRYHHLVFYIVFLMGASLFLLAGISTFGWLVGHLFGERAAVVLLSMAHGLALPVTFAVVYFGVFFGFVSRRFERQADLFGCRAVSCGLADCPPHGRAKATEITVTTKLCPVGIDIFVAALEKIALLNGATREVRSWRHFSTSKRVDFLQRVATQPRMEQQFHRSVMLIKTLVILGLFGGIWWVRDNAPGVLDELLTR